MNFRIITEQEAIELSRRSFNPPVISDLFSREDYAAEYWEFHGLLSKRLLILGEENDYGDGDFVMNQDYGLSRFVSIELSTRKLWSKELICVLSATLQEAPNE